MRASAFWLIGTLVCIGTSVHGQYPGDTAAPPESGNGTPPQSSEPANVSRIVTRQTSFTIPFTVDADTSQPSEVQLFVSADLGAHWALYARQHPSATGFPFRASRDGEYWFALKTIDRRGTARSAGPMKPELKVTVDTQPPRVDFKISVGNAGEAIGQWEVLDDNLAPERFQVEYQPTSIIGGNSEPWQQLTIESPSDGNARTTLSGTATWWLKTESPAVNIRAVAHDAAGNTEVVNRRLVLPKIASRPANNPTSSGGGFTPREDPFSRGRQAVQWPPDNANHAQNSRQQGPAERNPLAEFERQQPADSGANPPVANRVSTELRRAGETSAPPLPNGVNPRMTRSQRFNLRYDVETFGQDQVAKVELWATRDGGQTWQKWGQDADLQSPFQVDVKEDGVYGFKVVVTTASGMTGKAPRDGEPADIWIAVDTQKPNARITSVPMSGGGTQLIVNWQAQDRHFTDRPITLSFAESPNGPWTTLASGLPNTGQYVWRIDPRVPPQIYLRLEATDKAGNVAVDQLSRPIRLDALIPKGQILGFDPLDEN